MTKRPSCHVRIGGVPWCRCSMPAGFMAAAGTRGVSITCNHPNGADAVALTHLLQDFKLDAVIAEGTCEFDPHGKTTGRLHAPLAS